MLLPVRRGAAAEKSSSVKACMSESMGFLIAAVFGQLLVIFETLDPCEGIWGVISA